MVLRNLYTSAFQRGSDLYNFDLAFTFERIYQTLLIDLIFKFFGTFKIFEICLLLNPFSLENFLCSWGLHHTTGTLHCTYATGDSKDRPPARTRLDCVGAS